MSRLVLIAFALVLFSIPAEAQPTPQQRAACEQDAYRLCQEQIPDEAKVRNCLRRNMRRLSPVCRSAFTRRR
jgi:hypothetical protein